MIPDCPAPGVDERDVYPTCFDRGTWFAWKLTDEEPPRKIPRAPWAYPGHVNRYVGHNDPDVWADVETVREWASKLPGFGLANRVPDVEANEARPVFFDFDDVRDPETGEIHPEAWRFIQTHSLPAWVSSSGTGLHAFALVDELPDGWKEQVVIVLSEVEGWNHTEDPALEVYARRHFCALTGEHVEGTPTDAPDLTELVGRMIRERGEEKRASSPDAEPVKTRAELADVETTGDVQDILDAIRHTRPRDIRLRSTVTEERADGSKSLDPSWANSGSGTRLAQVDDGWIYRKGGVGLDALQVVALEDRIITSEGEYPTGEKFWQAVEALRGRGAHIPEHDPSEADNHEPVGVLPESPKARAAAQGWAWGAGTGGDDESLAPSQKDVYGRTTAAIGDVMGRRGQAVIDAIMGGGKTYSSFAAARDRNEPLAYFAPRGELYEQGVEYALENGYSEDEIHVLPSGPRDCPTFKGEHGDAARSRVWTLFNRGVTPKAIHNLLGDELPCCDNEDKKCVYEQLLEFDPDDYEVIIGHYKHAHLPHVTGGRHVVVDENPTDAFLTRIEGEQLIQGVNAFLSLHDSPSFDGWTDLLESRHAGDERREEALAWFHDFDFEPDEQNAVRFELEGFHAYAPHAVYAILTGEPVGDEDGYPFERATLPGIGNEARFFTTSEQCGEYFVELQTPPELEYARSVIALDGTPYVDPETADGNPEDRRAGEWENALGRPLNYRQVLTDEERALFLSKTQGNVYIQTSPYAKPYSSGRWNDKEADKAKLRAIAVQYGDGKAPLVFTEKKVRDEYEEDFLEAGLASGFDHSGNLRGSDEYGSVRFAVQLGSSHHGDHELRRRAAWLGATVEPEGKGMDRDYGDVGGGVLWQMREAQVAQNALRVGRDGNGALVCLDTAAFPEWLPVENPDAPGDVSLWGPTERRVHELFASDGGGEALTTVEITDALGDVSERTIQRACRRHADRGLLEARADPDDGRRTQWTDAGLGGLRRDDCAEVDLPDLETEVGTEGEVHDTSRMILYTRRCVNRSADERSPPPAVSTTAPLTATGDTGPPDPTD